MVTAKGQINLQDVFINHVRRERIEVAIHIQSGEQFSGFVDGFDNYTIILTSGDNQILIYKHAVSAVIPLSPVMIFTQNRSERKPD